jgi:hypothetical protein
MRDTVNTITRTSRLAAKQAANELRVLLEDINIIITENDLEKILTLCSSAENRLNALLSLLRTNEAKKQFMKLCDPQRTDWDSFNPKEFDQMKLRLSIAIKNAIIELMRKYVAMANTKYTININDIMIMKEKDTFLSSKYSPISLFSKHKTESIRPMEINTNNTIAIK